VCLHTIRARDESARRGSADQLMGERSQSTATSSFGRAGSTATASLTEGAMDVTFASGTRWRSVTWKGGRPASVTSRVNSHIGSLSVSASADGRCREQSCPGLGRGDHGRAVGARRELTRLQSGTMWSGLAGSISAPIVAPGSIMGT